jgi:CheY-like chemotaxis protein
MRSRLCLPALPSASETEISQEIANHKGTETVLVLDDEKFMREVISNMLISMGYSVITFNDGAGVMEKLSGNAGNEAGIVFMIFDLTIPGGKGGKDIIKDIRKILPDIPVIVASGYAEDPVIAHPEDYGFTASISKPFRKNDLSNLLEEKL